MKIEFKYTPGQKVWAINKYPIGAKVFEGEISHVTITLRKESDPMITYRLGIAGKMIFKESDIFENENNALSAREEWLNQI